MQSYDASRHNPPAPIAYVTLRNRKNGAIVTDGFLWRDHDGNRRSNAVGGGRALLCCGWCCRSPDGEQVLIATLDLEKATGRLARRSSENGLLGDWLKSGVERVRICE